MYKDIIYLAIIAALLIVVIIDRLTLAKIIRTTAASALSTTAYEMTASIDKTKKPDSVKKNLHKISGV